MLNVICTIPAIGDMGHLIGRGAMLSMLMVLTMLPALLVYFDKIITGRFGSLGNFLKQRRKQRQEHKKEKNGQRAAEEAA